MKVSCGIYLITPSGKMVICHPTNSPFCIWGIPKGIKEKNETELEAAKREFREETGFDIDKNEILHIESCGEPLKYKNKNKYFKGFVCLLKNEIEHELECKSMVTHLSEVPFPENDITLLVPLEKAFDRIVPLQKSYKDFILFTYNKYYEKY